MFKSLNFQTLYIHFFFFFIEISIFRNCVFFSFFNVFDVIWFHFIVFSHFISRFENAKFSQHFTALIVFFSVFQSSTSWYSLSASWFRLLKRESDWETQYNCRHSEDSWNKSSVNWKKSWRRKRWKSQLSFVLAILKFQIDAYSKSKIKWRNRQQSVRLLQGSWCIEFRWLSLSCCCCFMKLIFYKSRVASDP